MSTLPANTASRRDGLQAAVATVESELQRYLGAGVSLCASSSFQTHSLPLLHMIGRFAPDTPVYFLDTGYHFPETLRFRNQVAVSFGLNVVDIRSHVTPLGQRDMEGRMLFASDPDHCCWLNKTQPMNQVLSKYDVWIAGLRRDQNAHRKNLGKEMPGPEGTTRFHPMLDWDAKMIWEYRKQWHLPEHPLEAQGYLSVGCEPCTGKYIPDQDGTDRGGRWAGMRKTECGLHTELIKEQS